MWLLTACACLLCSFDFDKSNSIDRKELGALLYAAGVRPHPLPTQRWARIAPGSALPPPACRRVSQVKNLSGEDVEAILNHLDTNKSGKVDFEEFWVWFKSSDISASTLANRYK